MSPAEQQPTTPHAHLAVGGHHLAYVGFVRDDTNGRYWGLHGVGFLVPRTENLLIVETDSENPSDPEHEARVEGVVVIGYLSGEVELRSSSSVESILAVIDLAATVAL
jgi:hypothetical protein